MKVLQDLNLPIKLLHGGDYNPDQWLDRPDILAEDIRLMKESHVNCVSLGIFAWAALEPEEGVYQFDWIEEIIQNLYENGIYTILATPTGAVPPWMSAKYEEVLQMNDLGVRNYPGSRHNFCQSSPVMRQKMREINTRLSERFGNHPGVIAWHISNEYGGNGRDSSCHCPHCQEAFRSWLKERYGTLDNLNHVWWTAFWSHTYTDWSQIHSPSDRGENTLHGLKLDWKRFVSHQMLDFAKDEIAAVKTHSSRPAGTNMMGFFKPLNYFEWGKEMDYVSWDNYPSWHTEADELGIAAEAAATHTLMRSIHRQPFLLMESTPSMVNWKPVNTLKRPGMHVLSSLQAVAHGSDSVQYFQWRKSRGSSEKFHGAVVDHKNGSNTRVFRDVTELGRRLELLGDKVPGTCNRPKVAVIFDWENWWALEDACAVFKPMDYKALFIKYFRPLWELGIDVDVQDMDGELDGYAVVIAPFNYMYRGDYAEKVRQYVKLGGCYVTTCWSGEVDDSDLCFLERQPLSDVLGIRTEEIDACEGWENQVVYHGKAYEVGGLRGLVHAESAKVLSAYEKDFYQGYPALTENTYGDGKAYFIASDNEMDFLRALYRDILAQAGVKCGLDAEFPDGVTVSERTGDGKTLWFLQNYNRGSAEVKLNAAYRNAETGEPLEGTLTMPMFSCYVLEKFSS